MEKVAASEVSGRPSPGRIRVPFTEASAWEPVGDGWQPLHGNFRDQGFSIEWHDFTTGGDLEWSRSFHPAGVEICLNLSGHGEVRAGGRELALEPFTTGFYGQSQSRLNAVRRGGEQHKFVTIEFSLDFLKRHIPDGEAGLDSRLDGFFARRSRAAAVVSDAAPLTNDQQQVIMALRQPPVPEAARRLWYQSKALEIAAAALYPAARPEELFCERQKRLARERVEKVIAILKENPAEPPTLEEIGRRVGCSHFYLSRTFTREMGKTISAHLRDLRMERAAALLREGRLNVTQVAFEVGYSSLSHFSTAFHEAFGCCPGLYPLATPTQRSLRLK